MKTTLLALLVAVMAVILFPARAEAKIPAIWNSGEDVFDCGPLPEPYTDAKSDDGKTLRAGYVCDITGVFWTYFSVKNCKPVAYNGDTTYMPPDGSPEKAELEKAIKAKYPESSMIRGFWNKFGWMIIALVVVLGVLVMIKEKLSAKHTDAAA